MSGRTWDRTRPRAERLATTRTDYSRGEQGNAPPNEGGTDTPGATRSDSALGQQEDGEADLDDDPRSQRGPSSEPPTPPVVAGDEPVG